MKKLAVVFGGGAAKGYAHIGVIRQLEKNGMVPDIILGTSMGAIVGGMYAIGKNSYELEDMAKRLKKVVKFSFKSIIRKEALFNNRNLKKLLKKEFGEKDLADTKIKCVVVATELKTGKEKDFSSGKLKDCVLASATIPGVFPNVVIDGVEYCDGGLTNNLPENIVDKYVDDVVILSIDVIGEYSRQAENLKNKMVESLINSSTIMTTEIVKNRRIDADIRLTISMPEISQFDFNSEAIDLAINKGEKEMKKQMKKLTELLRG